MAELREVDPGVVKLLREKLADPSTTLPEKYRILFSLRNIAGKHAQEAMLLGLKDESALLRHEVAYCLGQRQDPAAISTLITILSDAAEHPMVRHEAGEALGAIGGRECLAPLKAHANDPCLEVAQTCQLALQKLDYQRSSMIDAVSLGDGSPYLSVDPAPPAPSNTPVEELRSCLLDENERIFDRYRAMFALRNRGGPEAVSALADAFRASRSALLKHEVAYVLGQMQDAHAVLRLKDVLGDVEEDSMVRHEAAEALGSIAAPDCIGLLNQYAADADPIVAGSCVVALDMLMHEQSGEFQYAHVVA